jgi:hypothetical protein
MHSIVRRMQSMKMQLFPIRGCTAKSGSRVLCGVERSLLLMPCNGRRARENLIDASFKI